MSGETSRLPLACNLSGPELAVGRGEVEKIFAGRLQAEELEDGYEFWLSTSDVPGKIRVWDGRRRTRA
jgi:hypothetical protein